MELLVTPSRRLVLGALDLPCAVGKGGIVAADDKREGDGATPAGSWPFREVFFRADRLAPPPDIGLPARPLRRADGWCDAAEDPRYNRHVDHPYPASAERMWREDGLYDIVVVLGYNDAPPVPGKGSAIFFHCATHDYQPTEGCVAVSRQDMMRLLEQVSAPAAMTVRLA